MKKVELTCIGCPMGCQITVTLDDAGAVSSVDGFSCQVGKRYAVNEISNPQRVITSSVRVLGGTCKMCSVKTNGSVPKTKVLEYARLINRTVINAPVKAGDVVVENIAGSGIDVIATRNVEKA